jgi:hypothetical protein
MALAGKVSIAHSPLRANVMIITSPGAMFVHNKVVAEPPTLLARPTAFQSRGEQPR